MDTSTFTFANLDVQQRGGVFLSFPVAPDDRKSPQVSISKAFRELLVEAHGEDLHGNYVRGAEGRPWFAVTTMPEEVDQPTSKIGLYDETTKVGSTHLARLLATQFAPEQDDGRARLYYTGESQRLGDHWTLYRLEQPNS